MYNYLISIRFIFSAMIHALNVFKTSELTAFAPWF